ncbi:MAG: virulence protein E [Blastochloris sp.]|nr:virulence protein E [Blastochloris sp.]
MNARPYVPILSGGAASGGAAGRQDQRSVTTLLHKNPIRIAGFDRFDFELEAELSSIGILVRLNRLTGKVEVHSPAGVEPLTDNRETELWLATTYESNGKNPARQKFSDVLGVIAERRVHDPLATYLDGLKWDGEDRLDTWLTYYMGVEDTPYARAVGRKTLCAAVRRAKEPGCKSDHLPVLIGCQGVGKSTAIAALCPFPEWFGDQLKIGSDAKEVIEQTAGKWIIELPELTGIRKRQVEEIKAFLSAQRDEARQAYARHRTDRLRRFIVIGTTNTDEFLQDTTGNRRFWPVQVSAVDVEAIKADRDLLWAEAVAKYQREPLYLTDDEEQAGAAAAQAAAFEGNDWCDVIASKLPSNADLVVKSLDAWRFVGIEPSGIDAARRTQLEAAMKKLGFRKERRRIGNDRPTVYVRGDGDAAKVWSEFAF